MGRVGRVLRPREREKVAKPDEGRWDETIPMGEVSDLGRQRYGLFVGAIMVTAVFVFRAVVSAGKTLHCFDW